MNILVDMVCDHWFWGLLALGVLAWYTTVTVYVGYKGAIDIKHMLRDLAADHARKQVRK